MAQFTENSPTSPFTKTSSDFRLLERVRLQSFHGLLPEAETRVRCPGKHPPVLLEDLLKAEIISLQLVLAMEEIAASVKQFFESLGRGDGTQTNTGELDTKNPETSSLRCLQTALTQGTNALNQLTNLQISDSFTNSETPTDSFGGNSSSVVTKSSYPTSMSFTSSEGQSEQTEAIQDNKTVTKCLMFDNIKATTLTPWKPGCTRTEVNPMVSDGTSREPVNGDFMATNGHEDMECNEEGIEEMVKDAIKTLHDEIKELQLKHEKQFVAFAGKYWSHEDQNMRALLEKIVENLSPQDQNWTYHGKFDDHCMEQLFYFVSLQKTLKSCLAIIDTITLDHVVNCMEAESEFQTNDVATHGEVTDDIDVKLNNLGICRNTSNTSQEHPVSQPTCNHATHIDHVDKKMAGKTNDVLILPQVNGKRNSTSSCENQPEPKKRKKGKGLFACFNTKWSKRKKH